MVKVVGYPWWPSRICNAKNHSISSTLASLGRVLVAFVGDEELRIVRDNIDIKPYTGEREGKEDDMGKYDDDLVEKYEQVSESCS